MDGRQNFSQMSASALGRSISQGSLDPVDVCEYFLEAIEKAEDKTVFLEVTAERARAEALASRNRHKAGRSLGPLDGVPISWKDLFDVKGTRTTVGSDVFRSAPPAAQDATVVSHAAAAGMVCLGKVNLSEFAFSGLGINPHYGTPRNPFDTDTPRIPGGSSSGSAVSVASGLAPCSIGTDTGGSVRIPAALNGLVGYKSSERRIEKYGAFDLSPTLDTIGPLSKTVEDAVLLDAMLRGAVLPAAKHRSLQGVNILVPENIVFDDAEEAVVRNFDACIAKLETAGARITRSKMPIFEEMRNLTSEHGAIVSAESYLVHKMRIESSEGHKIDSRVVSRIMNGAKMSSFDLLTIQRERRRLIAAFSAELGDGLLAMPTVAHTAPEIAPLNADTQKYHAVNMLTLRNTMIGNFMATCGLALPSGCDARGLPTSILFSGPFESDDRLLSLGLGIEKELSELTG